MARPRTERTPKQVLYDRKFAAAADGRAAMQERAERDAFVEKNTARLREMRLAKEALAASEAPAEVAAKPAKQKRTVKA